MAFKKGNIPWNKNLKCKPLSEEHKKKIGERNKGRIPWNKDKPHSIETCQKISKGNKGKKRSKEICKKFSESHKGKPSPKKGTHLTEEIKQKISGENHYRWNPDRDWLRIKNKLYYFMKGQIQRTLHNKAREHTQELLGYSPIDLRSHLESRFDNKMNWDNYGTYWVVDHIISINSFLKQGINDPKIINALGNLQPLQWKENIIKGDK